MDILWFLIIGAVAGWIAGEIMRGDGFGIVGNIIVGIVGAVIGGFIFDVLGIGSGTITGDSTSGLLLSLIMAVIGACILLFIVNAVARNR